MQPRDTDQRTVLSAEDLGRWRMHHATMQAMSLLEHHGYSAREAEQLFLKDSMLIGELTERYHLDDSRPLRISVYTGEVFYMDGG
ncbi:hypothetical protein LCGC14_0391570 [marine sediment metagenome]|uniref:Uncharacterized protein n=1 Tax=marine sediment metagenome TaxID=412755 RepID=A0A0F9VLK7_9ZZZZ